MIRNRFAPLQRAAAIAALGVWFRADLAAAQVVTGRERILQSVTSAFATAERGEFASARRNLEQWLANCGPAADKLECRVLYASSLGSLLQRQAAVDRERRDSLYLDAVRFYDRILSEVPNEPEALYGKALAYRALGPHEWMESFFTQAATLDPGRGALYLTFKGDYYTQRRQWGPAANAYALAVQQDADNDGARSGVIEALSALGQSRRGELLRYGTDWELRYPASAIDAYGAVLTLTFASNGTPDATADAAVVGLVRAQSRNRLAVGAVPESVSIDWAPVREIRGFVQTASSRSAPWWRRDGERTGVLAQAALAGGRAANSARKYSLAESLWTEGVRLAPQLSAISVDLQRELALLYSRQQSLDPDHKKFDALEQQIFTDKMDMLAAGNLEAAQRYHTTLGLIYLERGVWQSPQRARSAEQQFVWALAKMDEREARQGFYQPFPELRALLAHHFDSTGQKKEAARYYADASRGFFDVDDIEGADSAMLHAGVLGEPATGLTYLLALRSRVASGAADACAADSLSTIRGIGNAAFIARQRFKVLADCSKIDGSRARRHALRAFALVDSAKVTLVGGADVARFERVMVMLLDPFGLTFRPDHLDPFPPAGASPIRVSLPGETLPFAYTAHRDDVIGARVGAAVISADGRPFQMVVSDGVVTIAPTAAVSPSLIARIRSVPGVRLVKGGGRVLQ
jgi:tetratricopeptide (TPR) repeat protein